MSHLLSYIAAIVILNIGFDYMPLIDLGSFGMLSPMAAFAGLVFVVRDFAQRGVGHWVWVGMVAGAGLSYLMADPFIALASVCAFATSEVVDWAIYTFTKKPFHERVLWSSAISTPVDTAVFLAFISLMSPGTFVLMVIAKMLAAVLIWYLWPRDAAYAGA